MPWQLAAAHHRHAGLARTQPAAIPLQVLSSAKSFQAKNTADGTNSNYDGKDYPVFTRTGGTVAFRRHDATTAEGVSKTNGKADYTFQRTVSKDRKTLTIEMFMKDSTGTPVTEVLVYDRIE